MKQLRAVLIPAGNDPVQEVYLDQTAGRDTLDSLQRLLGGYIEAVPVGGRDDLTAYANDDAKNLNRQVCDHCERPWVDDQTACAHCGGEESRWIAGLEPNVRATRLIYGDPETARERQEESLEEYRKAGFSVIDTTSMVEAQTGIPEPYIAGPLVVTGFDRQTGDTTPIPKDAAELLLGRAPGDANGDLPYPDKAPLCAICGKTQREAKNLNPLPDADEGWVCDTCLADAPESIKANMHKRMREAAVAAGSQPWLSLRASATTPDGDRAEIVLVEWRQGEATPAASGMSYFRQVWVADEQGNVTAILKDNIGNLRRGEKPHG